MSQINSIRTSQTQALAGITGAHQTPAKAASSPAVRGDQLDLSPTARLLAKAQDLPDIRVDLVSRVKAQITAGTYLTPDKVDSAISSLLEDLDID